MGTAAERNEENEAKDKKREKGDPRLHAPERISFVAIFCLPSLESPTVEALDCRIAGRRMASCLVSCALDWTRSLDVCQTSSFAGVDAGTFNPGIPGAGVGSCVGIDAGSGAGSVTGSSGIAGDDAFRS
jgi:hypothetical protein